MTWCEALPSLAATPDAARYYEDALRYFDEGNYPAAIVELKNAVQLDATDATSRVLLGRAYLHDGQPEAAEKELLSARAHGAHEHLIAAPLATAYLRQGRPRRVLEEFLPVSYPPSITLELLVLRGEAYLELGELQDADKAFRAAAHLDPDHAPALLGRALVHLRRGDPSTAERLVDVALSRAERDSQAWYLKGELRRLAGDLPAALASYDQAIALAPEHLAARYSRAAVRIDVDELEAARADLRFALERFELDPQALYMLAVILARTAEDERSADALQQAANALRLIDRDDLEDHVPSRLLVTGMVTYMLGNHEEAFKQLSRYLHSNPEHVEARRFLGAILLARGEALKALEVLEPARELAPEDPMLHVLAGDAHALRTNWRAAASAFDRAVGLEPARVTSRVRLAQAYLGMGDSAAAVRELQTAIAGDPDAIQPAALLALVHLEREEFQEALVAAEGLLVRDPELLLAVNVAGAAALGLGDLEGARERFEQAVALDEADPSGHFNLASLAAREGRHEVAAERYRGVLALDPDHVPATIELAKLAESAARSEEAIRWREKARVSDRPGVSANTLRLIELYLGTGQADAALALARSLHQLEPENLDLLEALGRAELAAGHPRYAEATFAQAARRAGYDAPRLHRIARHQLKADDLDNAYWTLNKAVGGDPDYLPAQSELVHVELRLGKREQARERAERVRTRHPESPLGDILLGDVLWASRQFAAATAAYAAASEKSPSLAIAGRLYETHLAAGDEGAALAALETWSERFPDDARAQQMLAAAYMKAGRFSRAQPIYESLLREEPSNVLALKNLALVYDAADDPRGRAFAERAFALAPDRADVLAALGSVLTRAGEAVQGLKHLRDAHTRAPHRVEIRHHIAAALEALGRHEEAERERQAAEAMASSAPTVATPAAQTTAPLGVAASSAPTPAANPEPEPAAPAAVDPGEEALPPGSSAFRVQLGSFRDADNAHRSWREILATHPSLFTALSKDVVRVDLGAEKGVWFRLQAGSLSSRADAEQLCGELKRRDPRSWCLTVQINPD